MNLKEIKSPQDIKGMSVAELEVLAVEMRDALMRKLSHRGGHVGPNLGMVEATIALHYVFDSPKDKLIFDVSHQSYAHKMLTGRVNGFVNVRDYDKVSGYTNPLESEHDHFTIGHTSTAVSLAGGLAVGRDMTGGEGNVIAVVGDGSLSGGEALEGLDFAATLKTNLIIVVNDNDMSIAENHGGLYENLRLLRLTNGEAHSNIFKAMNLHYMYVGDGNNIRALIHAFEKVKDIDHPIVVHINTIKGKGYTFAETKKEAFHWSPPFNVATGRLADATYRENYSDVFALHMLERMKRNPAEAVITAGTPGVLGFTPERRQVAGSQFIDVGIAEQEAVALASGMAKAGARPCFGVVSSFIQRAYDQLSQDVAINNSPMVLNIFHGSIFAMNDVTHLGWFDIPLISNIPGWVYLAPTCKEEYLSMLDWAMEQKQYPVAIRVPGGQLVSANITFPEDYSDLNKSHIVTEGKDVAVIAVGSFMRIGLDLHAKLEAHGIKCTLINPRFLSGLDAEMLEGLKRDHRMVVTIEDGVLDGGYGEKVARFYGDSSMKVKCYGIPKCFRDRYNPALLLREWRLDSRLITEDVIHYMRD
jgi:1-deoxy-D-xylulose-5-phosphate synthase